MIDRSNRHSRQSEYIEEMTQYAATLGMIKRVGKAEAKEILGRNYRDKEPVIYRSVGPNDERLKKCGVPFGFRLGGKWGR